jgi:hypothetical protein
MVWISRNTQGQVSVLCYWVLHSIVYSIGFIVINTLESALSSYSIKILHHHLPVKINKHMEYSSWTSCCSAELQTRFFPNRSLNRLFVRGVLLVIYTIGAQLRQDPNLWALSSLKDAKLGYIYILILHFIFISTSNIISIYFSVTNFRTFWSFIAVTTSRT